MYLKYNTDRKEAKYIQINHIVGNLMTNKKITEEKDGGIRIDVFDDTNFKNGDRPGTAIRNTYGKRNSGKSDTNTKKFGNSKYGRRKQSYRKCKPSITSNAIHRTPRTKKTPFELHHGRKPRTELTLLKTVKRIYLIGQNFLFQHQ